MITLFKKMSNSSKLLSWVLSLSLFFFIAISLDASPYLRGPVDSIIESRWPYYFVADTLTRVWIFIPILIGFILISIYVYNRDKFSRKNEILALTGLVLLVFLFQIALVYFSRFGITILFRRLVDPGINGYFTEAIRITDVSSFLSSFPDLINERNMAQHASGHPPGAILLTKWFVDLISLLPINQLNFLSEIRPGWAKDLWEGLNLHQRFAALTFPFILHFISSLTIVPFYFTSKRIFGNTKVAFKATILFSSIPSLSFFALIFDPLYALIILIATFLIATGSFNKKSYYFFFAGFVCGIGLFATAATLTYLFGLLIYAFLSYKRVLVKSLVYFVLGISSVVFILNMLNFNLLATLVAVVENQASRDYLPWLLFNPYDFFVFLGFPISVVFFYMSYLIFKRKYNLNATIYSLFISFCITFGILVASGASRGEVGRIWLPFMFVPALLAANFLSDLKFSRNQFIIIFALVFIQTIIMEAFWVPIW